MYEKEYHNKDLKECTFCITGGAGFIGSNIAEYLLKHNSKKVVAFDNLSTGFRKNIEPFLSNPNFIFIEGDICNLESVVHAFDGIDYVSHQAALGSVPRSIEDPISTNEANVTGFLNVLEAAKSKDIKKVVYASSSSVYGDHQAMPKVEENTGNPLSPYAVSKQVDELYAGVFARTYGLNIIGLRYFNIFGPRQNPKGAYAAAIPLFIDLIINNQSPCVYGDGEQVRDFTFVENAVQANIKGFFLDENLAGDVFNIAVGEETSVNELIGILKGLIGSDQSTIYLDERLGEIK
ncbi:MAG: NAD-dependent epimerase/dehydratase family protein, partial [Bacteroidetes bacterium]|nr:NAD-dependent epimerase/dehydratase family protein [Bacteroidota bacterium]